uniref:Uncharacterized protein n=1 Tax=Candidatus Methanogaster sp. ANME-2c ERB4 TaxID=2759911 RepID=A0A7G9Y258_9EURY|nr:hypothetical protein JLNJNHCF_00002 [Methanosarcinales archaeon ANME-2c ERB4]QNO42092.1 hypothetical protein CDLGKOMF_00003 [Methanosarcinales archaeon ANME-2c ERB4]QNO48757.1 hypothetical protein IBEPLGGF_00038 [Methanosarcinales archaeon ANME-2c ERB4]
MQADKALSSVRQDADSASDGRLRSKTWRRRYPRRTGISRARWGATVQRYIYQLSSVETAALSPIKVLMIEDKYVVPED